MHAHIIDRCILLALCILIVLLLLTKHDSDYVCMHIL